MHIYSVRDLKSIYKSTARTGRVKPFTDCTCFTVVDKDEDRFSHYIYAGTQFVKLGEVPLYGVAF